MYGGNVGQVNTSNYNVTNGLHDYNSSSYINLQRVGYSVKS